MDKVNKWNEWSEHVVKELENNNKLNRSQKSLTTFLLILVGILISLIGYIWVDEKSDNKERYELMTKTLNTLIENDRNQDNKITEINQWREDWEKAKKEHNARGGNSSQTPNQLINRIQFVPDESQVAGR
jgi:exosome complex RNA-binding protein Rrp4